MLLQHRQDELKRQAMEAQQAMAGQERANLLSMLSPKEQLEARVFGLDYVERARQREDERMYLDRVRDDARAREDRIAEERLAEKREDERLKFEREQAGNKSLAEYILGGGRGTGMVGPPMPPAPMGPPPGRVIEPWEEKALAKARVQIPEGFVTRRDYELERQRADRQLRSQESEQRKKDEAARDLIGNQEIMKSLWAARTGGNSEVPNEMLRAVASGADPYKVMTEFYDKRAAGNKDMEAARAKREDSIMSMRSEYADSKIALEDVIQKDRLGKRSASEGKIKALWDKRKIIGRRLFKALAKKIVDNEDITDEELEVFEELGELFGGEKVSVGPDELEEQSGDQMPVRIS
jgi:hypothetical protein